jgi:general secretion pathway protein G
MFNVLNKNHKGFTLIELLVVIGIIGLLATIITMNVQSARQKARCAKRRADIVSLQAPLEAYYDANKTYPNTSGAWWSPDNCYSYGGHDVYGSNGWIPNLAPTYIRRLPSDPKPGSIGPCYLYNSDGTNYKILVHHPHLDGAVWDTKDTLYDPVRPYGGGNDAWMVCSGEPACSSW